VPRSQSSSQGPDLRRYGSLADPLPPLAAQTTRRTAHYPTQHQGRSVRLLGDFEDRAGLVTALSGCGLRVATAKPAVGAWDYAIIGTGVSKQQITLAAAVADEVLAERDATALFSAYTQDERRPAAQSTQD
jgi:hypothetical protein